MRRHEASLQTGQLYEKTAPSTAAGARPTGAGSTGASVRSGRPGTATASPGPRPSACSARSSRTKRRSRARRRSGSAPSRLTTPRNGAFLRCRRQELVTNTDARGRRGHRMRSSPPLLDLSVTGASELRVGALSYLSRGTPRSAWRVQARSDARPLKLCRARQACRNVSCTGSPDSSKGPAFGSSARAARAGGARPAARRWRRRRWRCRR